MGNRILRVLAALSLFYFAGVPEWALSADAVETGTPATGQTAEVEAIRSELKMQFEKPEAPLKVDPITVVGKYALVGWVQAGMGGRALLKKEQGRWSVLLCGGDGLAKEHELVQAGMDPVSAKALSAGNKAAEALLPDGYRKQLSKFGRTTRMN